MTRPPPDDPLLRRLTLGTLTLKNRVYSTRHAPSGYLENGRPGLRYELYHEEKAKGGLALTIIGGSSNVAPDSASVFDQIDAGHDDILPFYRSISDRVHKHGTAIMIQLTHLGRRSQWDIGDWLVPVAPSPVRERAHRAFPKAIELPHVEVVESGAQYLTSPRDVLSQQVTPGVRVLVYDDHGAETALTAAEHLAAGGAIVEIATPDRHVGMEVTGTVYPDYLQR